MTCPKCGSQMENMGNVSGMVYTSFPEQWDDVYACHQCRVKVAVRVHAELPKHMRINIDQYEQVKK